MKKFCVVLYLLLVMGISAQEKPFVFVEEGRITIGDKSFKDWGKMPFIMADLGGQNRKKGIGVGKVFGAYSTKALYFKMFLTYNIDAYKKGKNEDQVILEMSFDVDQNSKTGNKKGAYNGATITGYEFRYVLSYKKGSGLVADHFFYHPKGGFKQSRHQLTEKNGDIFVTRNQLEIKIPFHPIKLHPSKKNIRILYYENINNQHHQVKYNLPYARKPLGSAVKETVELASTTTVAKKEPKQATNRKPNKKKPAPKPKPVAKQPKAAAKVPPKVNAQPAATVIQAQEVEPQNKKAAAPVEKSGFTIWHLAFITTWLFLFVCSLAIAPKAGLPNWSAMLNIVPFVGQIAFLFILAFKPWPLNDDYHSLEQEISAYGEDF